jgi:hypothetical protein
METGCGLKRVVANAKPKRERHHLGIAHPHTRCTRPQQPRPSNDTVAENPRITALRRTLCKAVVAAVTAWSTRRSASGCGMPVVVATSRTR